MTDEPSGTGSPAMEPARRLYDLVLDYAERSLASQVELVRAFEAEAARWAASVGEVVIDDDDDEHLRLTAEGRFSGRVVDDETGQWEAVDSPARVAAHYDPVDLFNDLADAMEELFPGLRQDADAGVEDDAAPEGVEPSEPTAPPMWKSGTGEANGFESESTEPPAVDGSGPFHEQIRALEDLRNAGVMTSAQFETAKAKLTHR